MRNSLITCLVLMLANSLFGQDGKKSLTTSYHNTFGLDTLTAIEWESVQLTKSGNNYRLDSILYEDYDTASGLWLKQVSTLFVLGASGITQETIQRSWNINNGSWVNQTRYVDSIKAGQRTFRIQYSWDDPGEIWIPGSRNIYQRDSIGSILYFLQQRYILTEWVDYNQKFYLYDSLGNRTELTSQDYIDSAWFNNYRYLYTFSGDTLTSYTDQYWSPGDSSWVNSTRYLYDYLDNGLRLSDTVQSWNIALGWLPITLVNYYWTVGDLIKEKVYRTWDSNNSLWNDAVSYLYYQNEPGMDTLVIYRYWYGFWKELNQYKFSYGSGGRLSEELWQEWDEAGARWLNDYRVTYYRTLIDEALSVRIVDSTSLLCHGNTDGTATAQAYGGLPPYQYQWDDDQLTTGPVVANLGPGRYYRVVVTDANLDAAIDSLILSNPEPVITGPVSGDTVAYYNDTITYSLPHTGFYFQWTITGGTIISGQGTDTVQIVWDNEPLGLISVVETNIKGCEGDPVFLEVSLSPLSSKYLKEFIDINLFPNPYPGHGPLHVYYQPGSYESIMIFTITGKIIKSVQLDGSGHSTLYPHNLPSGIYLLQFRGNHNQIKKMVIR